MGIRVAYGNKANINTAIQDGIIPIDSIIIAKSDDTAEAKMELMFYNNQSQLQTIVPNTRFGTTEEALAYTLQPDSIGRVVTVLDVETDKYIAYVVQPDLSLSKVSDSAPMKNPIINLTGQDIIISDLETGIYNIDGTWKVNGADESRASYDDDLFYVLKGLDGNTSMSWISSAGVKTFQNKPPEPGQEETPPVIVEDQTVTATTAADYMVATF